MLLFQLLLVTLYGSETETETPWRGKHPLSMFHMGQPMLPISWLVVSPYYISQTLWKSHEQTKKSCLDQVKALNETHTKPSSHVIFNLDGVIIDSLPPIIDSHDRYLAKWRKSLSKKLKIELLGMRSSDGGEFVTKELDLPIDAGVYGTGVWQVQRDYYLKHNIKLKKGVEELLCYFKEQKIPIALICNSNTKSFNLRTKKHKHLLDMFCHIVLADDKYVKHGLPHPDLYEVAASRFRFAPKDMEKYLVFESTINGVKGAEAAGMQTILYPDPLIPKSMYAEADVVIPSLNKFEPKLFGMPPMKQR